MASDLFTSRSPFHYEACSRENSVARGVYFCDASILMTLDRQTFRKFFSRKVSEDLLDNAEGIIVDKLVCTWFRLQWGRLNRD